MEISTSGKNEDSEKPVHEMPKHFFHVPDEAKPHAEALGAMVMMFSSMELQISMLLNYMLDLDFSAKGGIVSGLDIMPKIRLIRSLGVLIGKDKPDDWLNRLLTLLNKIENELCPKRNRMVHDLWTTIDESKDLIRFTLKPRVCKQSYELKMDYIQISVKDMKDLTSQIYVACMELIGLSLELKPSLKEISQQQ